MATTREVEGLKGAARLIDGIADSLDKGEMPNVAPDDLLGFAADLRLTAEEADDRMRKGEFDVGGDQ